MHPDQRRGFQAALFAYTLWGLLTIYWKQLAGLDAFQLIGWRVVTATIIMLAVVAAGGHWPAIKQALSTPATLSRLVGAAVLLTVNWTTYVWAVVNDRVIETALGYFLAPLGTMALGVFVLGEKLTTIKRVSIGLVLVAVAVLAGSAGRVPWVALGLAISWSWYGLTKRRVPLDAIASLTAELIVLATPALGLVIVGWYQADGIPHKAAGVDWIFLLGTGAITATPLLLFAFAAKRVPFTMLGPTNFLVPGINFLLGWLVYHETITSSALIGFGLVWVALALTTGESLLTGRMTIPDVVAAEAQ